MSSGTVMPGFCVFHTKYVISDNKFEIKTEGTKKKQRVNGNSLIMTLTTYILSSKHILLVQPSPFGDVNKRLQKNSVGTARYV